MVSALVHGSNGSGSSPGRGHCVVFLGQDTLLSQCLSPPRSINGYRRFVGENLAASCYENRDKLRPDGGSWLYKAHFFFLFFHMLLHMYLVG